MSFFFHGHLLLLLFYFVNMSRILLHLLMLISSTIPNACNGNENEGISIFLSLLKLTNICILSDNTFIEYLIYMVIIDNHLQLRISRIIIYLSQATWLLTCVKISWYSQPFCSTEFLNHRYKMLFLIKDINFVVIIIIHQNLFSSLKEINVILHYQWKKQ